MDRTAHQNPTGRGTPLVSVVIPTYNRAGMVPGAVESVLRQTHENLEVIVVDDGSTDGTATALHPFMDRIVYLRQDNSGIAGARNRGIRESNGEFVAFLDSDDLWEPRMLSAVIKTFDTHPECGAVFSAEIEIDNEGRRGKIHTKKSPGIFFSPASMISTDTGVGCGRPGVVRRHWIEKLGGFDERIRCAVDCDIWIRYSFHMPMVLQPEPLVLRRIHGDNLSGNTRQDAEDWLYLLDKIRRDHPGFMRDHAGVHRRAVAKQHLRYGRELLNSGSESRDTLEKARKSLLKASTTYPWFLRCHTYVLWAYLAPRQYRRWRRLEMSHKKRMADRRR